MYSITKEVDEKICIIFPPGSAFPILPNRKPGPQLTNFFYQAMTDVKLDRIPSDQFTQLLEDDKEASRLMLNYVTSLAEDLASRLSIIENKDAKHKIINLLEYLIKVCSREI